MKYPCNLVRDLLPLYHDGICSDESSEVIETHLSECNTCKAFYEELCKSDAIINTPLNSENEIKKANSFKGIKKKLLRKQILIGVIVFVVLVSLIFSVISMLKNSEQLIMFDDNITVYMTEGNLIGRLTGNEANCLEIKRVEITVEGKSNTYLFFCLSGTKWNELTTSDNTFSEYSLCPADKGAEAIDFVYYYNGDYEKFKDINEQQLKSILKQSYMLWCK